MHGGCGRPGYSHSAPRTRTTIRVRARATDDYLAHTPQAEERFREDLELVSEATEPWIGARFELLEFARWAEWSAQLPSDTLVSRLEQEDSGADVDLVVGLVGRLSAIPDGQFDTIGQARWLGKHMVLRDLSADALAWVEERLDGASREVRRSAFLASYRHATSALFLHEWGHVLGAVHSLDGSSLMVATYSTRAFDFDRTNKKIVEISLPRLFPRPRAATEWTSLAGALRAVIEASAPGVLAPNDQAKALALLDSVQHRP